MLPENPKNRTRVPAQADIAVTDEQQIELKSLLEIWDEEKGLVVASLARTDDGLKITFRVVPQKIGLKIIEIVDEFYEGENNVNSTEKHNTN